MVTGSGSGSGIFLGSLTGVIVVNSHVTGSIDGFHLPGASSDNTLEDNTANDSKVGFDLLDSAGNAFSRNESKSNENDGVDLEYSDTSRFIKNKSEENGGDGFEADPAIIGDTFTKYKTDNNGAIWYRDA